MAMKRKKVTFSEESNGCHICTSHAVQPDGYPRITVKGRSHHAHRVLYIEAYGPLPEGIVVRHTCDNPRCINLLHLVGGTHGENARDRVSRGRHVSTRGDQSVRAKVNSGIVKEIRVSLLPQRALAEKYGICQQQVSRIKRGERWAQ